MWKDIFEAKIIRIDGFNNEEITCDLSLNDKPQDQFPALIQSKSIQLNSSGTYSLTFTSKSFQKGVSFKTTLFEEDGAQWLPLFDSNDFLERLPEETNTPRFLMVLCKNRALDIIEESGEVSEDSSLNVSESEDLMPEVKLGESRCNTQEFFESIDSEFLDQSSIRENPELELQSSEKFTNVWEPGGSVFSEPNERNSFELFKDTLNLKSSLDEVTEKFNRLTEQNDARDTRVMEFEQKFLKALENNKEMALRAQEREESLLELINEKEMEFKVAQDEIMRLRSEKRKLEVENKRLKDANDGMKAELELCSPALYYEEMKYYKEKMNELEMLVSKTTVNNDLAKKISEKDDIIRQLQMNINRFRQLEFDPRDSQNSTLYIIDELDEAVKQNSKSMNLQVPFIKDKEQMYIYGNRKLSLVLKNGDLMCRIGSNFKPFKEYMENFVLESTPAPVKKKVQNENSLDSEYDIDNFKDPQLKPKSVLGRITKHSLSRRKTKT